MTTAEIESYAAIGGLDSPDINPRVILRRCIVPKFMELVGYVSWRRKPGSASVVQGTQAYDLPDDFGTLMGQPSLKAAGEDTQYGLTYIGDDPAKIIAAEAETDQDQPTGYYFVRRVTTEVFKRVKFNCPPDKAYSLGFLYYSHVQFADDITSVEMDKYIPSQFQWTLVEGLKAYLYSVRIGQGDSRKAEADAEASMRAMLATANLELTSGRRPRFMC